MSVGDRSFAVSAPRLRNTLPDDIIYAPSLSVFRRKLKTFIFQKSYRNFILLSILLLVFPCCATVVWNILNNHLCNVMLLGSLRDEVSQKPK